ncbi:thiol:disulfide interchange protein DsbA/DsbL [Chromobacterium aquaticum]|uniref:Thiol:disulfide interchange protein n=1 Tax=Chromobacterium aquaticum TaxID=467180 RepID=A0ABV8ZT39_9NEIS|nr:thiol:disulfide interchange protein DsbA/DsbL [Chromobacterium aquaticum]MCD5360810.1 thiol:disulfide interchange protein DsbA/DsbL [Chromobacterium aquaticum]
MRAFLLLCWFLLALGAAQAQVVVGKDYLVLPKPHPVSSGDKIEVAEFFSYPCRHCYAQDAAVSAWLKTQPADVSVVRKHVVWGKPMEGYARVFATLNVSGLMERLHGAAFRAVQHDKINLGEAAEFETWLRRQPGVDVAKTMAVYHSFAVKAQVEAIAKFTKDYRVFSTPMLVVDGKYAIAAAAPERSREVLDALLAKVRAQRNGEV